MIELRYVERLVTYTWNGEYIGQMHKVLQVRYVTHPDVNTTGWTEWQDVPTVQE